MFCYQCQETAKNTGCTKRGVCGKTNEVSNKQDLLIWNVKGLAELLKSFREEGNKVDRFTNEMVTSSLFITITNANFDEEFIDNEIQEVIDKKMEILNQLDQKDDFSENAIWNESMDQWKEKAEKVGVLEEENEDLRSLKELSLYGLKGAAAYMRHANVLGHFDEKLDEKLQELLQDSLKDYSVEEWIQKVMETGQLGVDVMALLDKANTDKYGNPEITEVNIGVGTRPGILISGHDLGDMEQLLEQSKDSGVDIYTHSEMLPANYYPAFKKYDHFVGNYGNAWWKQREEFESFHGPILMTTNCIVPPKDSYKDKLYTTGVASYPGCPHIEEKEGKKDFTEIIERAKECEAPEEIETGSIVGGFAHHQVFQLADKIVEAVKTGAIKKFVVMGGCDGRQKGRNYYTEFAEQLPEDTVILTAGCAKYRYNKLNLGDIGGIPRVLDAGQCNDSYSLAVIAMKLQEIFEMEDINELPIVYNIAWYEQKAVIVLLALLALGVKNIHLGPTLPAFLSPNVVEVLVDAFGIAPNGTVEEDMKELIRN
ncbi:MAG: hydroxylamine reductase [Tissierellia bacterium]|nr:hydroxylamine reductase [Tissierellia bacterium]